MRNIKYINFIKNKTIKRDIYKNCFYALLGGGFICLFGQVLISIFNGLCNLSKETSITLTTFVVIFISSFLTGIGVFDKLGALFGAGTYLPVTGFANTMTSSALEYKNEGLFLGILSNMFKLAGAIIVTGILSASFFGLLYFALGW